jgi:hypothetical protein
MIKQRGNEEDWIERVPKDSIVYRCMQAPRTLWVKGPGAMVLKEFGSSVHIVNPNVKCLSMLGKVVAILPKNKLQIIYNLIGEYLEKCAD